MLYQIKHNGRTIDVEIVYRKRKTMEVQVKGSDTVRVLAPKFLSQNKIIAALESKTEWIKNKLDLVSEREQQIVPKRFIAGELFDYLGKKYELVITKDNCIPKPDVKLGLTTLQITTFDITRDEIKAILTEWYQQQALDLLVKRVETYVTQVGKKPKYIKLSNARTRWGSCSSKGSLLINWRLIMAPLEVFDYVVVHELCHLVHMNHSSDYWNLVESIIPDYKQCKQWLKEKGMGLVL